MGRHKEFDQAATLERAKDVFWEVGYERASMNKLLEVMGIGKKSLYDTYGTKAELFEQALISYHDKVSALVFQNAERADSGLSKIRSVFSTSLEIDAGTGRGCLVANTIAETDGKMLPKIHDLLSTWSAEMTEGFLALLSEAQREGDIESSADLQKMAELLANAYLGFRLQLKLCRPKAEMEQLADTIVASL